MARKNPYELRQFRTWSVNGESPVGSSMQYNRERWIVYAWNRKTRVLTLVNEDAWVSVIDPLCFRWDK